MEGSMASAEVDEDGLRFFNSLSGRLHVRLSEPTQPISQRLLNQAAPPSARIEEVRTVIPGERGSARPGTQGRRLHALHPRPWVPDIALRAIPG
jgi:hypothetical protein